MSVNKDNKVEGIKVAINTNTKKQNKNIVYNIVDNKSMIVGVWDLKLNIIT